MRSRLLFAIVWMSVNALGTEVCFSPENHCDGKFLKFLSGAQGSLDIAVFDITHDGIANTIINLSQKAKIRMIVDHRQAKGQHSKVASLLNGGVDVRYGHQQGIMHNKFTIVDGQSIETGSFNYTASASEKNNENQIYINEGEVVAIYQSRFEELWQKATPITDLGKN